jgi:hypothetical protein
MNWSLTFIFGLTLLAIFFFKKCEEFKGGRGFRMGGGGGNRTFDIIDVVGIVLIIYYLFLNK